MHTNAYGQNSPLTVVDRFGVWLSARQIRRWVPDFRAKAIGDFGCGYDATFARSVLHTVGRAVLLDVALAPDLKNNPKVKGIEGSLPEAAGALRDNSLDVIMCVSVLEHLRDPVRTLVAFHRILAPGGICLLNVPSWRGKYFLELSAFRLGLSPIDAVNDHKMYYDTRDLWPLLVQAGFVPSNICCFSHKFGLNTFAVCRKSKQD